MLTFYLFPAEVNLSKNLGDAGSSPVLLSASDIYVLYDKPAKWVKPIMVKKKVYGRKKFR